MFGKKEEQEKKPGLFDQSKESWIETFKISFLGNRARISQDQKVLMDFMMVVIKQNEEILEELKKLNSK